MLLRSASSPLLNSAWVAPGKEAGAHEFPAGAVELSVSHIPRVRSVAHLSPCLSSCSSSSFGSTPSASSPCARRRLVTTMSRALSEGDLSGLSATAVPKCRAPRFAAPGLSSSLEEEGEEVFDTTPRSGFPSSAASSLDRLLSSSGLDEGGLAVAEGVEGYRVAVIVLDDGCTGSGDGGGKIWGGGGRGRHGGGGGGGSTNDGNGGFDLSDSNSGNDATDTYYRQMIKADPANSLILGNYAKFLKDVSVTKPWESVVSSIPPLFRPCRPCCSPPFQVRGDVAKAQEYCERAIVANPGDAEVLALYADLVWETSRDGPRAESYFARAVEAAPDDW
ncbi:hypothetical protein BHE74_00005579 [Ensete ventricosum]|nr:hypothetical protein GW17_00007556 [Ensete ventricosum]RWW85711.1 hypothetical protein BHE74_00005579 [Ensete ventricosum]RZR83270.1 hypothetical protein BHM03_00009852 [Ensete ventricosum]